VGLADLMRGKNVAPTGYVHQIVATPIHSPEELNPQVITSNTYRLDKARLDAKQTGQNLAKMEAKRDLLKEQMDAAIIRRMEAQHTLDVCDKVLILLQKTSEYAREQVKARMEELVTTALNVVFGKPYRFWMVLGVLAGKPVAEYWVEVDGVHVQLKPPDYGKGGGVIDVVTTALRLGIFELEQELGPLLFDEVGKHISRDFAPNMAYFLHEYAAQFDRQIILNTHNKDLAAAGDVAVRVYQEGGKSYVTSKIDEGGGDIEA